MTTKGRSLADLAVNYHKGLPRRIRRYLNDRGIPDVVIDYHLLGWNGWRITIPIHDRGGNLVFFKLAKDPEDKTEGPKFITWPQGSAELYGWEQIKGKPSQIVICEGEFDRLVLQANGFRSITSTGGAGVFRQEWVKDFELIPEVYICFDRDEAGRNGALKVGWMIPHAKIAELPEEVGEGGDVTDFFIRLGKSHDDFSKLLQEAKPAPPAPEPIAPAYVPRNSSHDSLLRQQVERIKRSVEIAAVIGQYVKLRPSGDAFVGLCPFHNDKIPSLAVYPETSTFHCYGCRKHGDVIGFLREIEGMSFSQALDALDRFKSYHDESNASQNR